MIVILLNVLSVARADERTEFFETRIRPQLVKHCYECHSSASSKAEGGLKLDFRDALLAGGESGKALVAGKPEESLLIEAIRYESLEMPPSGKLPDDVIADFEKWIRDGAVDPRERPASADDSPASSWQAELAVRSKWWSLQPPRDVVPPACDDATWSAEPVDRFVHAALSDAGLSPAKPATASVLLRRLAFVLTGLPPTSEQVESFPAKYADHPQRALEELVDELLASPHFGERFARHWMDVVRYTDTYGYEWDIPAKGSWEYRDYLIRAFNSDVAFDQLIREQVAGDLLSSPRINDDEGLNESMIGPMFYHMGEHRHGSSLAFNGIHQEMIDNKIDAFSKTFLAMTVACARCHDHKLDAISQADYYALAGVFMTPRWTARPIDSPGKYEEQIEELKKLRAAIQTELGKAWTTNRGGLASGVALRKWAVENRDQIKDAKQEDIAWPLLQLMTDVEDRPVSETWMQLVEEWRRTHETRRKANERFEPLTNFSTPGLPDGWVADGAGMEHGYVTSGTPLVSLGGDQLVAEFLDAGYHTRALSPKLPGALRSPAPQTFAKQRVTLKLAGGEWAGRRDIPENAFLNEGPQFFDPKAAPAWMGVAAPGLTNGVTRVLTEITTASLNSNFPPRTGVANSGGVRLSDTDEGFDKLSWFSVTGIVSNDGGGGPADELSEFAGLYGRDNPVSEDACWDQLRDWLASSINRWAAGQAKPADVKLLNWLLSSKLLPGDAASLPDVSRLVDRYREVEASIGFPRSANSMDERGVQPVNYRLNIRGDVYREADPVPRGFLQVFADGQRVGYDEGSGRLELAEYLSSRDNPQTARVFVNRVWHWVFGTGLVATPNDFGKLGDRPSHPELLDWLANQFVEEGWSTKKLIRRLVLSQAFRQSGTVSDTAADRDPANRLLHHYPTRRLEAEAIRDSLLAVSGSLDRQLYGRPINPPRTAEDSMKRLFSGPLDSHRRRSLYIEMSIMEPPAFLVGFNLPDLKLPTGRRDETNVPAQALAMLNDPLVIQQAEHWGEQLVNDQSETVAQRVRAMFIQALGRTPDEQELKLWTNAVTSFSSSGDTMSDRQAWTELAHTMFNTKEFIYYR